MLLNVAEHIEKYKPLSGWHIGTVIDNNDPEKLGAIKVSIPNLLDISDINESIWIFPQQSFNVGCSNVSGNLFVPEIGSEVIVIFPFNDIYSGFYIGYTLNNISKLTSGHLDQNYPNSYGFEDSNGTYARVDKLIHEVKLHHVSGTDILVDTLGNVTINVPSTQYTTIGVNDTLTVRGDKVTGVGGHKEETVVGHRTAIVGLDDSLTATGNKIDIIGGNESNTITGNKVDIVGITHSETITGAKIVVVGGISSETVTGEKSITAPTIRIYGEVEVYGDVTANDFHTR